MEDHLHSIVGSLGLIALLVWLVWRWTRQPRRRIPAALRVLPLHPLALLPDGVRVRTVGRVGSSGELLRAPFTGRRCVCYEATVEQYHTVGTPSQRGRWIERAREVAATTFKVRAGRAEAEVVLAGDERPDLFLRSDQQLHSDVFHEPIPEMEAFLARNQVEGKGLLLRHNFRYTEAIIESGETVVVGGTVARQIVRPPFVVEGEPAETSRFVLHGGPAGPLILTDDPATVLEHATEHNRRFADPDAPAGSA